jgi:predicted ATPase
MALSSFTVANYRSFLRPTTIELRPLTLLFGYNNSGKSALLRVLPLLADSVGTPRGAPLNLDSAAVRGASFRDLCSQPDSPFSSCLAHRRTSFPRWSVSSR